MGWELTLACTECVRSLSHPCQPSWALRHPHGIQGMILGSCRAAGHSHPHKAGSASRPREQNGRSQRGAVLALQNPRRRLNEEVCVFKFGAVLGRGWGQIPKSERYLRI